MFVACLKGVITNISTKHGWKGAWQEERELAYQSKAFQFHSSAIKAHMNGRGIKPGLS
jgi:uncharacterized protein involved in tolerance to divalent cations